jgi:hypothetical protein
MKFIKFIQDINEAPGMYLVNKVEDVDLIILGYLSAQIDDLEYESIKAVLNTFNDFVNKYYETNEDYQWARLIRFNCSTDLITREMFAKLFSEFIQTKNFI